MTILEVPLHTPNAEEHVPEDIQPRQLIIAIQSNLGITKKEISERTGISYGTLNRYTRNPPSGGRPRPSSMQKLINLYRISCKRYGTASDHPAGGEAKSGADESKPGEAYRRVLLGGPNHEADDHAHAPATAAPAGSQSPLDAFMTKVALYARDDLQAFEASGFRDRARLEESRALVGDAYLAMVHAMSAEAVARRVAALEGGASATVNGDTGDRGTAERGTVEGSAGGTGEGSIVSETPAAHRDGAAAMPGNVVPVEDPAEDPVEATRRHLHGPDGAFGLTERP